MSQKLTIRSASSRASVMGLEPLETRTHLSATRIMPLGDSITEAFSGHASYRWALYNQLEAAGYDVDFVGSQTGVNGGSPLLSNFDQNHEGHVGWRADQIEDSVASWAAAAKPQVVLLHVGTNDILQGQANSGTITEIGGIIDNLRSVLSNVKILLARIIPGSSNLSQYTDLNNRIAALASQKNSAQSPITVVDQYSGFSASNDLYDGIHPTDSGERKIANKWFTALRSILPAPTLPPVTTYLSDLSWSKMTNAWGPVQKDRSNGEDGSNDGATLSMNGVGYLKGLGAHAGSDVRYNIAGHSYTDFRADVGVDDEVGDDGSVVFQVYVDNVLKYTSPLLKGTSARQSIVVPVLGGSTLRLVITDGGDGNAYDHGDWGNARLTQAGELSAPVNLSATSGNQQVRLSWVDTSTGETGFRLQRKTGVNGAYALIADLAAGTQTYTDTTAQPGQTYSYRIYGYNADGSSEISNVANIKVSGQKGENNGQMGAFFH